MKNLKKRKNLISALFSTQTLTDDWPDALDSFTGLVTKKCTKLGKTSENLILSRGLSHIKITLWYLMHGVISFSFYNAMPIGRFAPIRLIHE